MELRHLRHFVALAEEGHFGRAAERVFVVQQALSNSIRNLEEEVGVQLVQRTTRHVELTPAGEVFLEGARQTLALAAQTVERTQRAARGEVGQLTIGFVSGLAFGRLPEMVRRFREEYPLVSVDLRELSAQEQEAGLRSGHIDIGLMLLPVRTAQLEYRALWQQHLMAALPAEHPLAGESQLHIQQLANERFVFFPRHLRATYYDQVMRWCMSAGFTPNIVQEANEVPTLLSLVSAGIGIFLPIQFFARVGLPGIVYIPLKDAPLIDMVAVWKRSAAPSPLVQTFLRVADEVVAEAQAELA